MIAQIFLQLGYGNRLSPRNGNFHDLKAMHCGNFGPTLAELASVDHQNLFTRLEQAVHSGGHGSRSRAGKRENRLGRTEQLFQQFFRFQQSIPESRFAMVDHVLGKNQPDPFGQRGRTGCEQTRLVEHGFSFADYFQTRRPKTLR